MMCCVVFSPTCKICRAGRRVLIGCLRTLDGGNAYERNATGSRATIFIGGHGHPHVRGTADEDRIDIAQGAVISAPRGHLAEESAVYAADITDAGFVDTSGCECGRRID